MYYVYVLKGVRNGKRYIGYSGKLPEARLKEHNNGSNRYTKMNGPFELIHKEEYADKTIAIKRENFLKSGQGRKFLDDLLGS
ncbi:MAG TPA: GIY-YIG nuclease family protein [Candidatus Paceibacterota bacterium]